MGVALTPRDAKLMVRYLDAVDDAVTIRLSDGFTPDEPFLTMLLCEMLDQNQTSRHALSYTFDTLKGELLQDPKGLNAELSIETIKYPTHLESKVTYSDFGVIVEYDDDMVPKSSFTKAALFQAKKLYPAGGRSYSLGSRFEAFDIDQLAKIANLSLNVPNALYYLFYCPRPAAFDEATRSVVQRLSIPIDDIYDFAAGWHRYEYANDPNRHIPGLLAGDLGWLQMRYLQDNGNGLLSAKRRSPLPSANDVYGRLWHDVSAFSWFLVYDMLMGNAGNTTSDAIALATGQWRQDEPPVLPRYVIRLKVSLTLPHSDNGEHTFQG